MKPSNYQRCSVVPEIKVVNDETREIGHLISTAAEDRAGDIVEATGADLGNYLKNPVVLGNHDYRWQEIIGRAETITIDGEGIFARTKFDDGPLGRDAFRLVKNGMARAWSIGFRPIEWDSMKDDKGMHKGFHFKKWELLEYSLVAVPMNPEAVTNAVQRGLIHEQNIPVLLEAQAETRSADAAIDETEPVAHGEGVSAAILAAAFKLQRHHSAQELEMKLRREGLT